MKSQSVKKKKIVTQRIDQSKHEVMRSTYDKASV